MARDERLALEVKLAEAWPGEAWRDVTVVVAVSGGADSVALVQGLAKLKSIGGGAGRLVVAHFDHRLRVGSGSDAEFVCALAAKLELPFVLGGADVATASMAAGDGREAAARQARYQFLCQAAERWGARYVVTAHTADDKVETVLFNVLRGTGLSGLAGIPRARRLSVAVSVLRPMLEISRQEVEEYLHALGQPFCVDESNRSCEFTRNRLRHELLPLLREGYGFDVDRSLKRLSRIAEDAQRVIERDATELLERCLLPGSTGHEVRIDVEPLRNEPAHLVREIFVLLWREKDWPLQAMGFEEWQQLAQLALGQGKVVTLPRGIRAQREDGKVLLCLRS